jgi:hypothetical protein
MRTPTRNSLRLRLANFDLPSRGRLDRGDADSAGQSPPPKWTATEPAIHAMASRPDDSRRQDSLLHRGMDHRVRRGDDEGHRFAANQTPRPRIERHSAWRAARGRESRARPSFAASFLANALAPPRTSTTTSTCCAPDSPRERDDVAIWIHCCIARTRCSARERRVCQNWTHGIAPRGVTRGDQRVPLFGGEGGRWRRYAQPVFAAT